MASIILICLWRSSKHPHWPSGVHRCPPGRCPCPRRCWRRSCWTWSGSSPRQNHAHIDRCPSCSNQPWNKIMSPTIVICAQPFGESSAAPGWCQVCPSPRRSPARRRSSSLCPADRWGWPGQWTSPRRRALWWPGPGPHCWSWSRCHKKL